MLSVLINHTLYNASTDKDNWIETSGRSLSILTGIDARTCTKIINQLAEENLIVKTKAKGKKYRIILSDHELFPLILTPTTKTKTRQSTKTEQEKESIAMAYALYSKRVKFDAETTGNKFNFLRMFKKLSIEDQQLFAIALDNFLEFQTEKGNKKAIGITTFLENGTWLEWASRSSEKKLAELKSHIPLLENRQYDTRSQEYITYVKVRDAARN
jgi:hypothetical protein